MAIMMGVVGLGSAGKMHLDGLRSLPGVAVRSVYDIDPKAAEAVAADWPDAQVMQSYDDMLSDSDLDAVVVATPDADHCAQTVAALDAGKHVLCEKPMAPTVPECVDMIAAERRAKGKKLMIGHSVRFTPVFAAIKRLVDAGALGDIAYVGTDYQHDYSNLKGTWRFDPGLGRHTFLGGGCHAIDLASWFVSSFTSVSAAANHISLPELPTDDCLVATYTSARGEISRVFVAAGCKRPYQIGLEVYGTEGTAMATNVDDEVRVWLNSTAALGPEWVRTAIRDRESHPVRRELEHFVTCIDRDEQPRIGGVDGLNTVRGALAGIAASKSGQHVSIPADEGLGQ